MHSEWTTGWSPHTIQSRMQYLMQHQGPHSGPSAVLVIICQGHKCILKALVYLNYQVCACQPLMFQSFSKVSIPTLSVQLCKTLALSLGYTLESLWSDMEYVIGIASHLTDFTYLQ